MEKLEGKALLAEVLAEINTFSHDMFNPPRKLCEHDKKLFTLEDVFLKQIFVASLYYARETEQLRTKIKYEPDDQASETEASKTSAKEDLFRILFWFMLRSQYDLFNYPSIGIRHGWHVVEDTHEDEPPEIIKKLLNM